MTEKDYNLIETTVESAKALKQIRDYINHYFWVDFITNADLDNDDAVEVAYKREVNKCKWLSIWASKAMAEDKIKMEFDEDTKEFIIRF